MTTVRLLKEKHYSANWVFMVPPIPAGAIVPVVEATNLPAHTAGIRYWVNTPELERDPYGILLEPGDYELVTI